MYKLLRFFIIVFIPSKTSAFTAWDCPQKCTLEDLWLANKTGFDVALYWAKNL
jgi:hypothetical protein